MITNDYLKFLNNVLILTCIIILIGYFFKIFFKWKKNKQYFYEKISKTKYISTIMINDEEKEVEIKKEQTNS